MSESKEYLSLLEDMVHLHKAKNAGYAGDSEDPWANFRFAEMFGVTPLQGCMVRLSDKFIRTSNLMKNPAHEQVGENIKDTLMDLAAYSLIAVCLLNEEEGVKEYVSKKATNI